MWRRLTFLVVLAGLLISAIPAAAEKVYSADAYLVKARLVEGGSLSVQEQITFRFDGGPFSYVYRELPLSYTDGIVDVSAGVDGQTWAAGTGPGQVEISGSDPLRITWHLPETSDAVHTFDLNYRMLGVVRQETDFDLLRWRPLPNPYAYQIAHGVVIIDYPPNIALLEEPAVSVGKAQIASQPGRVAFTGSDLTPNTVIEIELIFPAGSIISTTPAWQTTQLEEAAPREEQNQQGVYWLIVSGFFILLGAAGAIIATHPYRRVTAVKKDLAYSPPEEVAPAIAGVLRTGSGTPAWSHAQGTLFDLASRGLIIIEEDRAKKWYSSQDFIIRRLENEIGSWKTSTRPALWPHEQAFLDLLFSDSSGRQNDSVKMSTLGKVITSSRWKLFSETLKAELKTNGLWSKEREIARHRFMMVGLLFLTLAILTLPLIIVVFNQSGLWSLALMVALALISIAWFAAGASITVWSQAGEALAEEWEPFYRYLKEVARGKVTPGRPDEFERYLPYAAAYGQLHTWAKGFEKKGWKKTPAYFRSVSAADEGRSSMTAFVAMTAVTSSSGGSAAGAGTAGGAAGGAAGGGASGAG